MAYPNNLAEYRRMFSAEDEAEIESKLGLFQAFSKLYENDRKLLDDMLAIESNHQLPIVNYIQSMICEQQIYIISNLATGKSKSFYSKDGLWTIGRDPRQSNIAMPDKRLSRCHAALQYSPEQGFILSDLESTNGTYVNGEKLQRVYALRDGDRIRIGSSLFHFFHCGIERSTTETPDDSNSSTEGGRTLH
ncbi:FHA domain-containing protein [Leptothoe spongobia]|uniref:FHA domain-containing protein n=1 Tax=Leptothoe spongobia TAU-MAC 1115 TaxID=1967444 RepID=A0A947GJJ1_9CYAN|nr:FHA domain-containing protein [Leptothoe spongobia]MBT9315702.1 FHA domain-containing protein [Leptothoe spongobia TAU-MAC 1115]